VPWSREAFLTEFDNRTAIMLGARGGGALLGYIVVEHVVDEAHIMTFAVREHARRQGVGKALLLAAFEELEKIYVRRVTLEVRQSNAAAYHLYLKMGFEEVGRRPRYYSDNGEDALILAKVFSAQSIE
jgi:ribosomal-protein-alanine N-acetyltransferase